MPKPHARDPNPYLSVIAWPDGWTKEQVVDLLARKSGMDAPTLKFRVGQAPPMILGQVDPAAAKMAMDAIIEHGGDAFAPTLDQLTSLGPTLKIKDLRLEDGKLVVDLWRGPSAAIRREQVQILIRAHLDKSTLTHLPRASSGIGILGASTARPGPGQRSMVAYGLGGAAGLAVAYGAGYIANASDYVEKITETSDKLDIHTTDGLVYQLDGDKFGYNILGELRGHSDKANMDAMCELLTHLAPEPIVDPYFSLWRTPAGYKRLRLPDMKINNDDPEFAFYSRWAALLYRHLMGV